MKREFTLDNIDSVAAELWESGKGTKVWTFEGDMSAGKTTLIAAICHHLGVLDAVSSPTYALVNEYRFLRDGAETSLFHSDWYRLSGADEAIESGLEELFSDPAAYCFVEWPTRAASLLPQSVFRVRLTNIDANTRTLEAD